MIEKIFHIRQIDGDKILMKVLGIDRGIILNEINIANAITFFTKVSKLYFEEFAHDNLLKEAEIYCTFLEKENSKLKRESERTIAHYETLHKAVMEKKEEIKILKEIGNASHIEQVKKLKEEINRLKEIGNKKTEPVENNLNLLGQIENLKEKNKNLQEMVTNHCSKNKNLKTQINLMEEKMFNLTNQAMQGKFDIEFVRMVLGKALKQGVI